MLIFLSWSGDQSRRVAAALHGCLRKIIQSLDPWMSEKDIALGTRWSPEIASRLQEVKYGVICVTPENMRSPWLNFEAGACSKIVDESKVTPYVFGLPLGSVELPLGQFQGTPATEDGTWHLVKNLNKELPNPLSENDLKETFDAFWPKLEKELASIPPAGNAPPPRSEREILEEVLQHLREVTRWQKRLPAELWALLQPSELGGGLSAYVRSPMALRDLALTRATPLENLKRMADALGYDPQTEASKGEPKGEP